MSARSRIPAIAAAAVMLCAVAAPLAATPPWISIEYPANPHDPATRSALLLVRTYHHGTQLQFPVRGTAEGLVAGRRQSVPLEITPTARPGVLAVRGRVPVEGAWVLALTLHNAQGGTAATALVALGPQREPVAVRVPHDIRDGWSVPRAATAGELEQMLRLTGAVAQAQQTVGPISRSGAKTAARTLAGLGLLLLMPLGWAVTSRRGRTHA